MPLFFQSEESVTIVSFVEEPSWEEAWLGRGAGRGGSLHRDAALYTPCPAWMPVPFAAHSSPIPFHSHSTHAAHAAHAATRSWSYLWYTMWIHIIAIRNDCIAISNTHINLASAIAVLVVVNNTVNIVSTARRTSPFSILIVRSFGRDRCWFQSTPARNCETYTNTPYAVFDMVGQLSKIKCGLQSLAVTDQ